MPESRTPRRTPFGAAEAIVDLFQKTKPTPATDTGTTVTAALRARARRAGLFRVPASISGPGDAARKLVAERFKTHLRGVSGANKLAQDPDESPPAAKRGVGLKPVRPGFGFRRPPVEMDMDDDEE
jgi:hypothetical protein